MNYNHTIYIRCLNGFTATIRRGKGIFGADIINQIKTVWLSQGGSNDNLTQGFKQYLKESLKEIKKEGDKWKK